MAGIYAAGLVNGGVAPTWHLRFNGAPAQVGFSPTITRAAVGQVRVNFYNPVGTGDVVPTATLMETALDGTLEIGPVTTVGGVSGFDVWTFLAGVPADLDFSVSVTSILGY